MICGCHLNVTLPVGTAVMKWAINFLISPTVILKQVVSKNHIWKNTSLTLATYFLRITILKTYLCLVSLVS